MKNNFFALLFVLILLFSCSSEHKDPKATGKYESINSGTFTCYVDESIWDFMREPLRLYDSAYPEIYPEFIKANARECMANLLSGNTKAIITPRDYLKDEDSLMKVFNVEKHERAIYALDGLVFYASRDFPLDTLTDEQIKKVLTEKNYSLKEIYSRLFYEPKFVCADQNSSEFANLKEIVLGRSPDFSKISFAKNSDSVMRMVRENSNLIGIGYLSQVVSDTSVKGLMISFIDSSGKYVFPHVVHQANILRKFYPYIIQHYVYIVEKRRDRVFWFAKFLEKEYLVQLYFNNAGIVPAYARIRLIER
jgi:hypothetical protein